MPKVQKGLIDTNYNFLYLPDRISYMPATVLYLKNAAIYQRDTLILSDVNVSIEKGEFVYLIGKTGTGKSSFMKTLYGDLPLKEGEGSIVDYDLRKLRKNRFRIYAESWAWSSRTLNCLATGPFMKIYHSSLRPRAGRTKRKWRTRSMKCLNA